MSLFEFSVRCKAIRSTTVLNVDRGCRASSWPFYLVAEHGGASRRSSNVSIGGESDFRVLRRQIDHSPDWLRSGGRLRLLCAGAGPASWQAHPGPAERCSTE